MSVLMIVFDMAGTTVDEDNVVYKTLQDAIVHYSYPVSLNQVLEFGAGKEKLQAIIDILENTGFKVTSDTIDLIFAYFNDKLAKNYDSLDVKPLPDVEHTFKDDFSLAVNAEKKLFYTALNNKAKEKGAITNPSTYWARIRKAGKEERLGTMSDEIAGEGSEGGDLINEGASGESKERSPQLRYVDELTSLYKYGERKGSELPANLLEVHALVGKALEACGVKLNMIST
jgi:hypothetical protein